MNKKNCVFGVVFVVMMVVLGLVTMVGCPTDGTNDDVGTSFNGVWSTIPDEYNYKLNISIKSDGSWTMFKNRISTSGWGSYKDVQKGTYTVSGNTITFTITHVNAAAEEENWKEIASLTDEEKNSYMRGTEITTQTAKSGNQFTIWGETFIKN